METKYKIESKRDFIAYSDLWHTANVLFEKAQNVRAGKIHIIRAAIVFRAFSFESFLLHIGSRFFQEVTSYQMKSVKDKLIFLNQKYSIGIDFSSRPFQTITVLFDKRNLLAHSKDDFLLATYTTKYGSTAEKYYQRKLKTDLENYCVLTNMEKTKEDARKCIEVIAEKLGIAKAELFRRGFSSGTIRAK
jgi:hypothetical protein